MVTKYSNDPTLSWSDYRPTMSIEQSYLDGFWAGGRNRSLPEEVLHNLRLVRELDTRTSALIGGRHDVTAAVQDLHADFALGSKAEQDRRRHLARHWSNQRDRARAQPRRAAASKRASVPASASSNTRRPRVPAILTGSARKNMDLCLDACNAKIELTKQTYELLDNHIRRLDRVLKRFDSEIELEEERLGGLRARGEKWGTLDIFGLQCDDSNDDEFSGYCPGRTSGYGGLVYDQTVDANEPTYCFCHQVAFGEMICCDNQDCRIEWFHFACVGLTPETRPTSKWLCPDCAARERKGTLADPCF